MWPWPTIKFQICSKMTKKAVLGVSSDLNSEPFSKCFINFRLEIILRLLENMFFLPRVRTYAKKSSKKCQFFISAHFPYIKDPQMYRKNVVSAAPGKSPPNFMKLFFQVCFMNRLGEKMVQLILKILGQTEHPSMNVSYAWYECVVMMIWEWLEYDINVLWVWYECVICMTWVCCDDDMRVAGVWY